MLDIRRIHKHLIQRIKEREACIGCDAGIDWASQEHRGLLSWPVRVGGEELLVHGWQGAKGHEEMRDG